MSKTIYLNHAGTSWPKPRVIVEAVERAFKTTPDRWPESFEHAHTSVCQYFGVANSEQLLLTPGCTSSLATAIANVELPSGSRVVTSGWEHHAVHAPLMKLQDRGYQVGTIAANATTPFDLNELEDILKVGNVGLVAITAACNVTGELLPIDDTIALAHRYDAMVLIDAAQIAGWIDLDLDALDADLVAFGGHKAMQSPWGIGGLYVNDSARLRCISSQCELPTNRNTETVRGNLFSKRLEYCDVGSVDQFSLAGLAAATEWLSDSDRQLRLSVARRQTERLRAVLERQDRAVLYGNQHANSRLPTIAFEITNQSSGTIAELLKQQGVIASGGLQCSPQSHRSLGTDQRGVVRLSVGVAQSDSDIDQAIERIDAALKPLGRTA